MAYPQCHQVTHGYSTLDHISLDYVQEVLTFSPKSYQGCLFDSRATESPSATNAGVLTRSKGRTLANVTARGSQLSRIVVHPRRESEKNRKSGPESEKNRESCPESEKNRESGPKSEKNRESGPESEGNQESGFKIRRKARYRFLKMEKNKVSIFKNEENKVSIFKNEDAKCIDF